MERKICFDRATLDNKIILDDDNYLVMPAVSTITASSIGVWHSEGANSIDIAWSAGT